MYLLQPLYRCKRNGTNRMTFHRFDEGWGYSNGCLCFTNVFYFFQYYNQYLHNYMGYCFHLIFWMSFENRKSFTKVFSLKRVYFVFANCILLFVRVPYIRCYGYRHFLNSNINMCMLVSGVLHAGFWSFIGLEIETSASITTDPSGWPTGINRSVRIYKTFINDFSFRTMHYYNFITAI